MHKRKIHLDLLKIDTMKYIPFIFLGLGLIACNKDDDTDSTAPTVNIISPNEDDHFDHGDTIHFEASASDNEALSQMKVEIHFSEDGHTHKVQNEWEESRTYDLNGMSQTIKDEFIVPLDADTGFHHFIVIALDEAGNSSSTQEVDFEIEEH